MENKELSYSFTLTKDDYVNYNIGLSPLKMAGQKKKMTILGAIEVIIALGVGIFMLVSGVHDTLVLVVLLLLFGINSMLYFKIFFPRSMRKMANSMYEGKTELFYDNTITISPAGVLEKNVYRENEELIPWQNIRAVYVTSEQYVLMAQEIGGLIIPRRAIPDTVELDSLLTQIHDEAGVKIEKL